MEVKVEGKKYEVTFDHLKSVSTKGEFKLTACGTRCVISAVKGKQITTIATGYARVAKGDQFSRTTGRRVALHKALVSVWPESKVIYTAESGIKKTIAPKKHRDVRTAFWKTYFAKVEAAK